MSRKAELAEIDRVMGIVRGVEGWHSFGLGGEEIHYVRDRKSLCGKWGYEGEVFQPHMGTRSRCNACRAESPPSQGNPR